MQSKPLSIFKNLKCYLVVALLFVTASPLLAAGAHSVSNVSGYVTVTSSTGEVKRLQSGDEIQNGDVVNTGADSGVSITLASGKVITLNALDSYTVAAINHGNDNGNGFAKRSLNSQSPTLSTATSAGGGVSNPTTPTTPPPGGSPTN